jgi:1,2-diacylglycerol-3-alpha-glucose alpha-1,2-galactosyltransferase
MDQQKKLRIHVASETEFVMKGQGVHTAFVEHVELLKSQDDIEVVVNNEGWGDILHCHTYGPYFFWKGRRYPGRRVHTVHVIPESIRGSLPAWRLLMPLVTRYLRMVFNYATVCIAISPRVEEALRELGVKSRLVRIYNPVHLEKWAPTPEKRSAGRKLLGLSDKEFVVLGVGQLEARKGVEDFLDIAKACPDLTFVWVGGRPFGVMTEGIAKLNRRIGAAGAHVKFPGLFDLAQMPSIYNAADMLLFPSYQENCPLVPIEGGAAGLPVIYRDIKEYVALYENPYLKAKDTPEFIAMTKRMAADPKFREEGRAIMQKLLTQFNKAEIRKRLITLYRDIAAGKYKV